MLFSFVLLVCWWIFKLCANCNKLYELRKKMLPSFVSMFGNFKISHRFSDALEVFYRTQKGFWTDFYTILQHKNTDENKPVEKEHMEDSRKNQDQVCKPLLPMESHAWGLFSPHECFVSQVSPPKSWLYKCGMSTWLTSAYAPLVYLEDTLTQLDHSPFKNQHLS